MNTRPGIDGGASPRPPRGGGGVTPTDRQFSELEHRLKIAESAIARAIELCDEADRRVGSLRTWAIRAALDTKDPVCGECGHYESDHVTPEYCSPNGGFCSCPEFTR